MNFIIQKKTYKEPVLFTLDNKRMVFGDCHQSGSGDVNCTQNGESAANACMGKGQSAGACGWGVTATTCYETGEDGTW